MSFKERVIVAWRKTRHYVLTIALLLTLCLLFFWNDIVITVHSGQLGVKYSRLWGGTDLRAPYAEGVHFIWPFDVFYVYDTRVLEHAEKMVMLTKTGLPVTVNISCRYQLDKAKLPQLHQVVGPEYKRKIILPMVKSVTRQVLGTYPVDSLYSSARQELEDVMMVKALSSLGRLPIIIHNIFIENISLPQEVEGAIVDKMVAEQRYKRYEYLLREEGEEAKRKHIEALGIQNFQALVNSGMTENYLRYQGVQATNNLAKSPNTKFIIAGGGKDGLPVILNTQDAPVPTPQATEKTAENHQGPQPETTAQENLVTQPSTEVGRIELLMQAINDVLGKPITIPAPSVIKPSKRSTD